MSVEVKAQNTLSMTSVKAIKDATDEANTLLDGMRQSAIEAGTTLNGIYQDAMDAQTSADNAQASADSASEYASRAYANLSTVQNITETLNWITAHGTMTLTTDTQLDPTHIYFVADQNGDYVVGGQHYAVVTEPDIADISTYYELSIDESLNNYVATHLAVDSEGLWIIPDAGGNKVLIATGSGSTYTTAGTYIIGKVNNVDTVFASFTADGIQIGNLNEARLMLDAIEQSYIDALGNDWLTIVADINTSRTFSRNNRFTGNGTRTVFATSSPLVLLESVTIDGVAQAEGTDYERNGNAIEFYTAPASGSVVSISYSSLQNNDTLYYTLGTRNATGTNGIGSVAEGFLNTASGEASHAEGKDTTTSGAYSHAEGNGSTASGEASHAEGYGRSSGAYSHAEGGLFGNDMAQTIASGQSSHAEGYLSVASGNLSHAQNYGTTANSNFQTALGKYNVADASDTYAVIIGNGTANNARSNALTVDWSGNVDIPSGAKYQINGTALSASDVGAIALSDLNDYIVAQSESAETSIGTGTWRWREWHSGKVEIWYRGSVTLDQTASNAGGLYRRYRRVVFPNSYALYKCSCVVNGTATGGWLNCGGLFNASGQAVDPVTQVEIMAYRISSSPDANQPNVNIYVCGEKSQSV